MLVLTRDIGFIGRDDPMRQNEVVLLLPSGERVSVYVNQSGDRRNNGRVRVGIEAPASVKILRGELDGDGPRAA